KRFVNQNIPMLPSVGNAISHASCTTAMDLDAKAIISLTHAGRTARLLSRFRPGCPIISTTVFPRVQRQLNLSWGVIPILVPEVTSTDELFEVGIECASKAGFLSDGDLVVMTGGTPVGMSGTTNTIKVQTIGSAITNGKGLPSENAKHNITSGTVCLIRDPEHADFSKIDAPEDLILVAPYTTNAMMPLIRRAKVLIVEDDDPSCHTATVAAALDIPAVLSCSNATRLLTNGRTVTVDTVKGSVS
ncbi:MAG: pyruvate kinase, partial [Clostridiales bacterium]|nr:pyruvate kinase [Clostridiales bacterium]